MKKRTGLILIALIALAAQSHGLTDALSLEKLDAELDPAREVALSGTFQRGALYVIGFKATLGKTYYIQYADNLSSNVWKTAYPSITALTDQIQWVDSAPPVTEDPTGGARCYRVIQAD